LTHEKIYDIIDITENEKGDLMATTVEAAFVKAGFAPLKEKKTRPQKIQKCHRCGADMKFLEGCNVMVCSGDIEKADENGQMRSVPCGNRFIFKSNS